MRVVLRVLLLIVYLPILTVSSPVLAENRGLLWEVTKKGVSGAETKKTYLMGAIHFGDESFYPLSKNTLNAFDSSSILYVEVDETRLSQREKKALLLKYTYYPEGETIRDHLSPEMIERFEKALAEFGVSLSVVEQQKPSFVGLVLAGLQARKLGYRPELGIDQHLLNKARNDKSIRQIETYEEQIQLLNLLPSDDTMLKDNFADINNYEATWNKMINAWKTGDGDALYQEVIAKSLKQYPNLQSYFELLFFKRNTKMAGTVQNCVENKESCFIVVGAGHLVGERGVVDLLKEKGYLVNQR